MTARFPHSLFTLALLSTPALLLNCASPSDKPELVAEAASGLTISGPLALSAGNAAPGETLTAQVTYTNNTGAPFVIQAVAIAARPPGGSHGGGPYLDFSPYASPTTLAPGESITVQASRTFSADDPTGAWDTYPTYQDGAGAWHDGDDATFTVGVLSGGLHTNGNQIVDAAGRNVRIASVGWNEIGAGPTQGIDANVALIKQAGFNCIRLPWVNARMDSDFALYDQVVAAAKAHGLWVIFDNHTNEVGHSEQDNFGAQQRNGLWYDLGGASNNTDGGGNQGTVDDGRFVADWVKVAQRYANNPTVIGYDLRNEPLAYGGMCTWGDGNFNTDLRWMYERVGNAVLAVDPNKLIICEGPQNYNVNFAGNSPAPWGDLSRAGDFPVRLDVPDRVVYSIHDYPQEIAGYQPDNGAGKVDQMNKVWGYLVTRRIAPVWIGEMGSSLQAPSDAAWAQTLIDYTNGRLGGLGGPTFGAGERGISTDWWAWGALDGQFPDGTQNDDGSLRQDQLNVYSQLR